MLCILHIIESEKKPPKGFCKQALRCYHVIVIALGLDATSLFNIII
jgi:hypothetical protein